MSTRPREALEFFQAIADGNVVLNAKDPSHAHSLRAALGALGEYAALVEVAPELTDVSAGLKPVEGAEPEAGLEAQVAALSRLARAIEERREGVEAELAELRRKVEAAARPVYQLGTVDDPWYSGAVAIDLGSSNVVCAHWNFQASDPVVTTYEPLAVNVLDAPGFSELKEDSYLVGAEALAHRSQKNLYRSFRRLLGTRTQSRPAVTGGKISQVSVADLASAVLQGALQRLSRSLGSGRIHFPQVTVTVPATGDQAFEYELRQVCERLGLTARTDLDEATAAGVYALLRPLLLREYANERRADGQPATPADYYQRHYGLAEGAPLDVVCLDLGGGTTDLAHLRLNLEQDTRSCRIHIEVLGTNGFTELSGEGLTLHLCDLLKRRLALAQAHPRRALGGGRPDAEPPHMHPWIDYHRLEQGATDFTLAGRLDANYRVLLANWEAVAGTGPLEPDVRQAVDEFFPTISEGASQQGAKFRKGHFRWLWDEAERLKRVVCEGLTEIERQSASGGILESDVAYGRLDLEGAPRFPHDYDLSAWLSKKGRVELDAIPVKGALAISSEDIADYVRSRGREGLLRAIRSLIGDSKVVRLLLAGNGAHAARPVIEEILSEELGLPSDHVVFDPDEAKRAVAKGACLWAIGNRLEGIEVSLTRRLRHPTGLVLVSALHREMLFKQGEPIERFCYAQPDTRESDRLDVLIQVDREVGGALEPFLMFDARKGTELRPLSQLPISRAPDVKVPEIDRFMETAREEARCAFRVRDAHQYVQTESAEWVSQAEVFSALSNRMTMEEAIAWMESSEHLRSDPPPGKAYHRYYMDDTRQLFLLLHTSTQRLLVPGVVVEQARREVSADTDPFSGKH